MLYLIAAATVLAGAVAYNFGTYHPRAIFGLGAALALCLAGNAQLRKAVKQPAAVWLFGLCFAFAFWQNRSTPLFHVRYGGLPFTPFLAGLALAFLLIAWGLFSKRNWWFPALIVVYLAMGVWVIRAIPTPEIDVWTVQMNSVKALLEGTNPYSLRTWVGEHYNPDFYGPGIVQNGYANFGYPYWPVTLFLSLPGYAAFGDIRYSQLLSLAATALIIGYGFPRASKVAKLAGSLFLFWPRGFYILESGWTEPFLVVLIAITVLTAMRRPGLLWIPAGALFASKQYMLLMFPLAYLLIPRWRDLAIFTVKAAGLGAAITLPLVLWSVPDFWRSTIAFQLAQPFRKDALSFTAFAVNHGWPPPPAALGFLLFAGAMAWCLWRNPRTPAGFASALAVSFFFFVSFAKQAFANYYSLIIGTLCIVIAACADSPEPEVKKPS